MSIENMLWGAPRIHSELHKLGFAVAQSTVAKYMARTDGSPSGQRCLVGAGMMGDRADVIFASPEEISGFISQQCL